MKKVNHHTSQVWKAHLRQLLLGTDQLSLPENWAQQLENYHVEGEDTPAQLLELIGKVHLLTKGTRALPRWSASLPPAPPPNAGTPCSWRSVQHLQLILNGHHTKALPEFIRLLHLYKKRLPAESIPALMDQCTETPTLWEMLRPLLGEAEYWLIRQHPHWSRLLPESGAFDDWPSAKGKAQYDSLAAYRQVDPVAARDSLIDHWLNLNYRTQARVLPALAIKLSTEDEKFLQHCLQSKRKEIRVVASDLLTRLPDSVLVDQLFQLASSVLEVRAQKLHLNLPDSIPTISKTYGIYPTGSKMPGGLKINWLQQLIKKIPFSRWTTAWQVSATETVQLFAQTKNASLLLNALNESLLRLPEKAGQEALVQWWLLSGQEVHWNNKNGKALLPYTSAGFFNESLVKWLEQFGPLLPADTLPAHWLATSSHPWSVPLSKIVVLGFQDIVQGLRTNQWHLWHYRQIFEAAGYGSDPSLLEQFRSGWSFRSTSFGRWHSDIEKMLQTLHFRQEMRAALAG